MNASCEHFIEYFKEFGPNAFNVIHGIFSACVSKEARRQKVSASVTLTKTNQWISIVWLHWTSQCTEEKKSLTQGRTHTQNCTPNRFSFNLYLCYCDEKSMNDSLFQALSCLCYTCGNSGPQLYSCLHCIFFGCKGQHIVEHLESKRHNIALELGFAMIYCHACRDFIYDPECYAMAEKHLRKEAR